MMIHRAVALGTALAAIATSLFGCGHDTPVVPTATTTTTTLHPRTPPLSSVEVAKYMNDLYVGFDDKDDTSPLGVTITMAGKPQDFFANIFCSKFDNPNGPTGCWKGNADCRLSASLYNHKMILNKTTNITLAGMGRAVGYVVNQSMVESRLAKCSFIWDGASGNRYNRGCGLGAPGTDCNTAGTAFDNICPSTQKTCTADDKEVTNAYCQPIPGGLHPLPPTHTGQPQCFLPGPAMDFHEQTDYQPRTENVKYLREMVKGRIARNDGHDDEGPNLEKWNEIVIDELLYLPDLEYDPAVVVPAIVYAKSQEGHAKTLAQQMQASFSKGLKVGNIPIVMIDDTELRPDGPFLPMPEDDVVTIV